MSGNLELILNKITNENIEINCRAMGNLLSKITNNLISLEQIDDRTGYQFLFSITKWLSIFLNNYQQYKYDPALIINVLNLFLKCIEIFPPSATENLKKDFKISSLINDVGSISPELSNLCDRIQHGLSRNALDIMSGRNTKNFTQNINIQEGNYSNRNTFNNNFAESYGPRNNIEEANNNYFNYTQPEGFRTNINMKISNVNNTVNFNQINNNFRNTMSDTNNNLNQNINNNSFRETHSAGNNSNISNNNSQNIKINNNVNNNVNNNDNSYMIKQNNKNNISSSLVNPSLVILHENIGEINPSRNMSKTMSKISRDEIINYNSQQTQNQIKNQKNKQEQNPTFVKPLIPQQEEQFIFDIGINLKYGDSVQIYHSFNIFYI